MTIIPRYFLFNFKFPNFSIPNLTITYHITINFILVILHNFKSNFITKKPKPNIPN